MLRVCVCLAAIAGLVAAQEPERPKITGVAHAAFYVSDIDKARGFYKDLLGYDEPFSLKNADGSLSLTFIKINDRQYIELFPEREPKSDRLNHISVETNDAEAMRAYLAAKGSKVPAKVGKGRIGNLNFNVRILQAIRSKSSNTCRTAGACATQENSCPTDGSRTE